MSRAYTIIRPEPGDTPAKANADPGAWAIHRSGPVTVVALRVDEVVSVLAPIDEWPALYRQWGDALRAAGVDLSQSPPEEDR